MIVDLDTLVTAELQRTINARGIPDFTKDVRNARPRNEVTPAIRTTVMYTTDKPARLGNSEIIAGIVDKSLHQLIVEMHDHQRVGYASKQYLGSVNMNLATMAEPISAGGFKLTWRLMVWITYAAVAVRHGGTRN